MKGQKINIEKIKSAFELMGFAIIHCPDNKETYGPDLWVQKKNSRPLSVEIKKLKKLKNGCYQVDAVLPARRNDDLIAIECGDYIFIEPMADHLKCCSPKGFRNLTILLGRNP